MKHRLTGAHPTVPRQVGAQRLYSVVWDGEKDEVGVPRGRRRVGESNERSRWEEPANPFSRSFTAGGRDDRMP